jgi:hypothetical protein
MDTNFSPPPAPLPYGPATLAIRKFLQRLAALNAGAEAQVMKRFADASETRSFRAAEVAVGVAIERSGRGAEQAALAGPLLQLVKTREGDLSSPAATDPSVDLRPIAEPALAALLALMMRDVLPANEFAELYEPFAVAIPTAGIL